MGIVKVMLHTTTIISITTVIQIHIQIQNTGGLCCFRHELVFLIPDFGPWRHEEGDTILTMLTPPQRAAHLLMFKISVGRDPKIPTTSFNGQNPTLASMVQSQLTSFQNPKILRTIFSGHDVIHTPAPFPLWRLIITMVIVISFARERKTVPNDYAPELSTRIVQSSTKLKDNI